MQFYAYSKTVQIHHCHMRWGLIPGWWKKPLKEMRVAAFNARSDRIATAPMFRDSFQRRRCLMPASGYYEWITAPDGKKLPVYFSRADGEAMTFAAIQDAWRNPETGERIRSCSIVITMRTSLFPKSMTECLSSWRPRTVSNGNRVKKKTPRH